LNLGGIVGEEVQRREQQQRKKEQQEKYLRNPAHQRQSRPFHELPPSACANWLCTFHDSRIGKRGL
jgi:hypothetical protein